MVRKSFSVRTIKYRAQAIVARALRHRALEPLFKLFVGAAALLLLFAAVRLVLASHPQLADLALVRYVATGALGLLALAGAINYYEYHGFGSQEGILRRGPDEKVVALTFDDGPSPEYTPLILDALKGYGVRATFFLVGKNVEKYPDIARRIAEEGHEIGNHTYSHRDLVPSSKRRLLKEIKKTQVAIANATGMWPTLFRPPRGIYSEAVRRVIVQNGFRMILWSVSGMDWSGIPASVIARRVVKHAGPGAIILLHDSGALIRSEGHSRMNTARAVPEIIERLRREGYRFVTISEMLSLVELERAPVEPVSTETVEATTQAR